MTHRMLHRVPAWRAGVLLCGMVFASTPALSQGCTEERRDVEDLGMQLTNVSNSIDRAAAAAAEAEKQVIAARAALRQCAATTPDHCQDEENAFGTALRNEHNARGEHTRLSVTNAGENRMNVLYQTYGAAQAALEACRQREAAARRPPIRVARPVPPPAPPPPPPPPEPPVNNVDPPQFPPADPMPAPVPGPTGPVVTLPPPPPPPPGPRVAGAGLQCFYHNGTQQWSFTTYDSSITECPPINGVHPVSPAGSPAPPRDPTFGQSRRFVLTSPPPTGLRSQVPPVFRRAVPQHQRIANLTPPSTPNVHTPRINRAAPNVSQRVRHIRQRYQPPRSPHGGRVARTPSSGHVRTARTPYGGRTPFGGQGRHARGPQGGQGRQRRH